MRLSFLLLTGVLFCGVSNAQQILALSDAVNRMDTTHPALKAADYQVQRQQDLKPSSVNLPNPQLLFQSPNGTQMRPSILWTTEFPTVYFRQHTIQEQQVSIAETQRKMKLNDLRYELSGWYFEIQYLDGLLAMMVKQDSAFLRVVEINKVRDSKGDLNALEKSQGETQYALYHAELLQAQSRKKNALMMFNRMIGAPNDTAFTAVVGFNPILVMVQDSLSGKNNPATSYFNQQVVLAQDQVRLEKNKALPGLMVGYFNQGPENTGTYYRLNFGVTIPLFFWQYSSRIKGAKSQVNVAEAEAESNQFNLQLEYARAIQLLQSSETMLNYYSAAGTTQSTELIRNAEASFKIGAIGQLEYLRLIDQSNALQRGKLESIFNYNKAALYIQYLNGFAS